MNKRINRLVAIILSIVMIMSSLMACGKREGDGYVVKGEFYRMIIEKFNYYPLEASVEEMEEADNYDIEAQTMVDWDLLPQKIAFKNTEKYITREEAALACLNTLTIKKTGKIGDAKDAELCDYPQEMVDAVANGIISLENGYIDGKQKITNEECIQMLNNTMIARTENVFEEDQGVVKYSDECHVISGSDIEELEENEFVVIGYEEADAYVNGTEETIDLSENLSEAPQTTSLLHVSGSSVSNLMQVNKVKTKTFTVNMPEPFFETHFKNCEVGKLICYTGYELPAYDPDQKLTYNYGQGITNKVSPFSGRLKEITYWDEKGATPLGWTSKEPCVTLTIEAIDDVEKMASTEISEVTNQLTGIEFEQLETKFHGYKITVKNNSSKTGVICTATKTYEVKENKYGNWRDATKHPKATFTASIDNICFTTDKLENFYKKGGTATLKVTCDTKESIELECGGLRLAPDSNRNGKFWSNLTNSRLTDGKGAESIKVAKTSYKIPYTGLSIELGVYLVIGIDGKISIELCQNGNGFEISKANNGKVTVTRLGTDSLNAEVNVNANIELLANVSVKFFLIKKSIISGEVAGGFEINAIMSLYYQEKDKPELAATGYGDPQEAAVAYELDDKIYFCVDVAVSPYVRGEVHKNNVIGEAADRFGYDISKWKFEINADEGSFIQMPKFHFHFENGAFVDQCKLNHDKNKESGNDETFTLSLTKMILEEEGAGVVYIVDKPVSDKKIKKENGIKVKSKDKNIAKVTYNKENDSIMVEAVSPGSTEIEVYVKKNKNSEKKYTQEFSITVSEKSQSTQADDLVVCVVAKAWVSSENILELRRDD